MPRFSPIQLIRARSGGGDHGRDTHIPEVRPAEVAPDEVEMLDERSFIRELDREIERAKRGSRRLSILLGQLGGAGQYDFVGQRPTDPLLELAGRALAGQRRQIDTLASIGRGRFALILPETGEPGALVVAQRLRAAVADVSGEHAVDSPKISFGVATFGRHGRTARALFGAAQRAVGAANDPGQDPRR